MEGKKPNRTWTVKQLTEQQSSLLAHIRLQYTRGIRQSMAAVMEAHGVEDFELRKDGIDGTVCMYVENFPNQPVFIYRDFKEWRDN